MTFLEMKNILWRIDSISGKRCWYYEPKIESNFFENPTFAQKRSQETRPFRSSGDKRTVLYTFFLSFAYRFLHTLV